MTHSIIKIIEVQNDQQSIGEVLFSNDPYIRLSKKWGCNIVNAKVGEVYKRTEDDNGKASYELEKWWYEK